MSATRSRVLQGTQEGCVELLGEGELVYFIWTVADQQPIVTQITQSGKMFEQRGLDGYMGNCTCTPSWSR